MKQSVIKKGEMVNAFVRKSKFSQNLVGFEMAGKLSHSSPERVIKVSPYILSTPHCNYQSQYFEFVKVARKKNKKSQKKT